MTQTTIEARTDSPATTRTGRCRAAQPKLNTTLSVEERHLLASDRPITFEQWVRLLRKDDPGYTYRVTTSGPHASQVTDGFTIEAEWLWAEQRPEVFTLIRQMLEH